jgi:hypothetical protein
MRVIWKQGGGWWLLCFNSMLTLIQNSAVCRPASTVCPAVTRLLCPLQS